MKKQNNYNIDLLQSYNYLSYTTTLDYKHTYLFYIYYTSGEMFFTTVQPDEYTFWKRMIPERNSSVSSFFNFSINVRLS